MRAVSATVRKELLILLKDPAALIMLFILPAIFILVLSLAMQGAFAEKDGEKFDLLVVNQDRGSFGEALIDNINANGYFRTVEMDDTDIAKRMVEIGKRPVLIVIPRNAARSLRGKGDANIFLYQDPAFSKEMSLSIMNGVREFIYLKSLDRAKSALDKQSDAIDELEGHVDTLSDKLEETAGSLSKLRDQMKSMLRRFGGRGPKIAGLEADTDTEELEFDKPKKAPSISSTLGLQVKQRYLGTGGRTDVKPSSVQQNVPGWTIFALFWIAQVFAINVISERQSGAFRRVMVSPISFYSYILSKSIPFLVINLFQALFLFLLGIYVLPLLGCTKLEIQNVPALILLTSAVSVSAVSFGLVLAGFLKTPFAAASVSASILVVMTAIAGIMVPKFIMPESMQRLTDFVPQGIALEGYLDVLLRGRSAAQILPKIGRLLLFSAGFAAVGFVRMRRLAK